MARRPPELLRVDGVDGPLGALRWPGIDGTPPVLAIHGITANAWHFDPLAHHLAGGADLLAVDLRGRGRSFGHRGPFGIRYNAADIARIARHLNGPVTIVAQSVGAFAALMAAEQYPGLVDGLILVDGGTPVARPDDHDPDTVTEEVFGPALARLRRMWPDRVSYETMWATHPAFDGGLSISLERNLLADLVETNGGFRAAVNESAVLAEGQELLLDDEVRTLLAIRDSPARILRSTANPLDEQPSVIPEAMEEQHPQHDWQTVEGTNHYTILLGPTGASAVADAVRATIAEH